MRNTAPRTPLRRALAESSSLLSQVEDGLGALADSHVRQIEVTIRAEFADSLDTDNALAKVSPQEHRWDYLLGHAPSGQVVAIEPHSARQDQVDTLIRKRRNAREQLRSHLRENVTIASWLWVASGNVQFADTEKAKLRLAQNGIEFVGRMILRKHLPDLRSTRKSVPLKRKGR